METAPGFSPWGLISRVMPHCVTSCLVLSFPINSFNQFFNQHLFAWAGLCRERCHAARSQIGRCSQLLTQERQTLDEVYSGHTWMRMTLVRTCYVDWYQWVKWKMCKQLRLPHVLYSQSQGYAALRNTAKCPSNVRWRRLQTYAFVM